MTDISAGGQQPLQHAARYNWLSLSAKTWFVVTAIGQWLFVTYILMYYGRKFLAGGVASFGDTHLPNGYIPGDTIGNAALVAHILIAGLIIAAGQIQLVPALRTKLPKLHRWSGRFYMMASVVVSIAGLYLVWSRERLIGSLTQDIGVSLGGVFVLLFVPIALYYAVKRDFAAHRRWALRLFMVVSAVWFIRLMIFGWFMATGGVGIDRETFSGPYLYIVSFAQFLLPLAILEFYFWAERPKNKAGRAPVAALVFLCSGLMAIGVFAVSFTIWIPRITG